MTDFTFAEHGNITILRPRTKAANAWVDEHIPDDALWFGAGVVIESRYADDILAGIQNDGLQVS